MKGKEMLVSKNDLVLSSEEEYVKLFVIFKDKKYGTKYIIFTDKDNKKLYYGNPLINQKTIVIMKFKNIKDEEAVKEFVWKYLNKEDTSNFEIIEIPDDLTKLELIDSNELDVKDEYILSLFGIFFKKEEDVVPKEKTVVKKKKKSHFLLFFIIVCICILGGIIYLNSNPELLYGKDIYYECKKKYDNTSVNANVDEYVLLIFNNSQKLINHKKYITYVFNDNDDYYDFKEKNLQYEYLSESGNEKFNDEEHEFLWFIDYDLKNNYIYPEGYDAILSYYQTNDYNCNLTEKETIQ